MGNSCIIKRRIRMVFGIGVLVFREPDRRNIPLGLLPLFVRAFRFVFGLLQKINCSDRNKEA